MGTHNAFLVRLLLDDVVGCLQIRPTIAPISGIHAAPPIKRRSLFSPLLKSGLALWLALTNRVQQQFCCMTSGLMPQKALQLLFSPSGKTAATSKKCLTTLLGERGPMEKERPWRVKYYKGRWEAQPAHSCFSHHSWGIRYERAHTWGPSAPAKLSEATPHGIEISHSQQVLLKLQNHEQINGGCFKPLSFWVVCFTTDSWTRKIKWDSSTPPSGWQV